MLPRTVTLADVLANSFCDLHAKGLDYLCLKRSETETHKVYFFSDEAEQSPEVVAPHDHRYPFTTTVLAGKLLNLRYRRYEDEEARLNCGKLYERFAYRTPLNGGDGFTWEKTDWLTVGQVNLYEVGQKHSHEAYDLHTISVRSGAVLHLLQGPDVVPLDQPTHCWRPLGDREGPDLSGLYREMSADRALWMIALAYYLADEPRPEILQ